MLLGLTPKVVVVSHIQRIVCQPEKTTLRGGHSRPWSAEQRKMIAKKVERQVVPTDRPASVLFQRETHKNNVIRPSGVVSLLYFDNTDLEI